MTMKLLLANAPWKEGTAYGVRAGSRWPHLEQAGADYVPFPFFMAYAASLLEAHDFDVAIIDAVAEKLGEGEFIRRALSAAPNLVVIEVSTVSLHADLAMVAQLRDAMNAETLIALCGLHQYMSDPAFLDQHKNVDLVLLGEYETALLDVASRLAAGKSLDSVPGVIFRQANGSVMKTADRILLASLDDLPWPARHLLPMTEYHDEPGGIPRPSVQMCASRGCPYGCKFCAWPQIMYGGNRYRTRSVVDVVDEMEWLVRCWGFKSIYFDDDTFNIGRDRMIRFCDEVKRRDLQVPWAIMARADLMDRDLLDTMRNAGLAAVKYGVESACQDILYRSGKNLDLKKVLQTVQQTKELDIKVHLTFMFGLEGETRETARETVDLALDLDPESLQFSIATPFPGSTLYEELEKTGRVCSHDWREFDGYSRAVLCTETMAAQELEECLSKANDAWRERLIQRGGASSRPPPATGEAISVIVPTWQRRYLLGSALSSLAGQSCAPVEVLIVNDGGGRSLDLVAQTRAGHTREIVLERNAGFAKAANEGIRSARGDLILVMNDDVRLDQDCIQHLKESLRRHPEAGFAAPKVLCAKDEHVIDSAGHGITRSGYSFNRGAGTRDGAAHEEPGYVFGAPASACLLRKQMLDDIGLFDEDFGWYLEDLDLSFRAQLRGYKCVYAPRAIALHVGQASTGSFYNRDNVFHIARNTIAVLLKNMPRRLLQGNALRIALFLAKQQLYHAVKTGNGRAYLAGLASGLRRLPHWIAKRKRILGGRRIDDREVAALIGQCEADARISRTKWK